MVEQIQVDPSNYARRWVSCLDLLGFSDLIRAKDWVYIFAYYKQAIDLCARDRGFEPAIEKIWFSDTFILYSPDDTASSFGSIEATTRWFLHFLVSAGIPVRGAMSCSDLYTDVQNRIFFGNALVESYYYGESQNWIGFVLSPSCIKQMASLGLPANERLNYVYWDIPYKRIDDSLETKLPALILGGSSQRNTCLDKLRKMKERLKGSTHIIKYENSIRFIESNLKIEASVGQNT
jgi:hypothetical protein